MLLPIAIAGKTESAARARATGIAIVLAGLAAACSPSPAPRTFFDFMEDGIAREGVLTRCNRDRDATVNDAECANARRAAAAVALEHERARRAELDLESERKLLAMRARSAADGETAQGTAAAQAPAFGAPLGAVLPSMSEASLFDVYADGTVPARPVFEAATATPPASDVEILPPELVLEEVAIVPRPFRTADGAVPQ